jgi:hypothetical protein
MPPVTYDTSVFKSYKPEGNPSGFLFSAIVIQELMASARDDSEMNRWAAARRAFEKSQVSPLSAAGGSVRRHPASYPPAALNSRGNYGVQISPE